MKKFAFLALFFLFFTSCEKDYLIPDTEVPGWLKAKISQDENLMKDSPKSMAYYGAWMRYQWQKEFYFEYHNVLSSDSPRPISMSGDTLHILANDINTAYCREKCCRQYAWKAPGYKEYSGI
jgi:hypothetical protein